MNWIKCGDRMPEFKLEEENDSQNYFLAYIDPSKRNRDGNQIVKIQMCDESYWIIADCYSGDQALKEEITYWMPLPEKPNELD